MNRRKIRSSIFLQVYKFLLCLVKEENLSAINDLASYFYWMVATHNDILSDSNHIRLEALLLYIEPLYNALNHILQNFMYRMLQNVVSGGIISINCTLHFDPAREDVSFGVGTICSKFYCSQVEKDKEQLADLSSTLPTARMQCWPKIQCNTVHQNAVQCKSQYHALHRTVMYHSIQSNKSVLVRFVI